MTDRRGNVSQLRTRVENAISSLLPHGKVVVDDVARSLGMSKRTLIRRLSDERLNFTEVRQQLRRELAIRYLDDPKLNISKIAWLLGFNEVSAFTHAFKRWTGKTPSQMVSEEQVRHKTGGHCPICDGQLKRWWVNQNEEISPNEAAQCRAISRRSELTRALGNGVPYKTTAD